MTTLLLTQMTLLDALREETKRNIAADILGEMPILEDLFRKANIPFKRHINPYTGSRSLSFIGNKGDTRVEYKVIYGRGKETGLLELISNNDIPLGYLNAEDIFGIYINHWGNLRSNAS